MIDTFERNINYMLQEVRDLKTAHKRGLGMTRFYHYGLEIYVEPNRTYSFVADLADGEPTNPFFMAQMSLDPPLNVIELWIVESFLLNNQLFFDVRIPNSSQEHLRLKVAVLSSSQLDGLRQA